MSAALQTEPKTLLVEGCETSYWRGGSGTPMLFLHGHESHDAWLPYMDGLARSFDLIVPDHPGFGASGTPPWLDSVHDLAHFYTSFRRTLALERLHLAGHGLGGWIACEMAVRDQGPFATLTLADAAGVRARGIDGIDPFMNSPEDLRRQLYDDPALGAMPTFDEATGERHLKDALMTTRLGWQPRFFDPLLPKWLHQVEIPALVVWGEHDRLFPPEYGRELTRLLPKAVFESIANSGHLPHIERPDAFVAAVTAFALGGTP